MIGVQITVMLIAMLGAGQREGDTSAAAPLSFEKKAEIAAGAPALCMMEWRITPGLECLRVFEARVPQLKGFPDELAKVLASGNERSRSAALLYLAQLAGIVRQTAWLRDRDDGDDLFAVALAKHVRSIRLGLETALQQTKGNDRLLAAVALLALTANHRVALDTLTDEMRTEEPARRRESCEWVGNVRLAHPRLITALAKAIADKDAKVRSGAVVAVAQIGPKAAGAAPAFFEWHKKGEALDGTNMISLLNPYRKGAWPPYAELDPDGTRAVPMLIERLKHGDADERLEGFAYLAQFGAKARQAIAALRPYLTSADEAERFGAAAALLCIDPDDSRAAEVLIKGVKSHSKAIRACAETTPKMKALVPLLIDALKHPAAETRQNAAEALGNMAALAEPAIPHLAALVGAAPTGGRDFDFRDPWVAARAGTDWQGKHPSAGENPRQTGACRGPRQCSVRFGFIPR